MQPRRLRDMQVGDTLMLAREIVQRTSVSQVYEKVNATTIRHTKSGNSQEISEDELVYPFQPGHAAPLT